MCRSSIFCFNFFQTPNEPASQLYKLHAKLDKLVMQIYGFSDSDDLLEKLLHLNQAIAAQEKDSNQ
jgi:hypothetical protein